MKRTIELTDIRTIPLAAAESTETNHVPRIMTVAGSDSSGGAGIEADLKTFTAHKCYGLTCINSLTAQNTLGVCDVKQLSEEFLVKILKANFEDIDIDAVKTGMLSENAISALLWALDTYNFQGPLVVDPVMVSTSGFELSRKSNVKLMVENLFAKAILITPNIPEAKAILEVLENQNNEISLKTPDDTIELCKRITNLSTVTNILIKGGHVNYGNNDVLYDVLYESKTDTTTLFKSKFLDTASTHGTGCTLASAIASNLAKQIPLSDAVGNAIVYVQNAIFHADKSIGSGHGPLCHFEAHEPIAFHEIDSTITQQQNKLDLMLYLKSHPDVQDYWHTYIHHPFIEKLATMQLPMEKFIGFLKQDHAYLLNYGKTYCLAAALTPNTAEFKKIVGILNNITTEIEKHKNKLLQLGITEQEVEQVKMNDACEAYSSYLFKVAKHGNWLEINVAMSACLFGYREAAFYGQHLYKKKEDSLRDTLYKEWLDDYCAEWYHNLCLEGENTIRKCTFQPLDMSRLIEIFKTVVKLEILFWDAFLD